MEQSLDVQYVPQVVENNVPHDNIIEEVHDNHEQLSIA